MDIQLVEVIELKGEIEVLSGLHIGAGSDEIHIGGTDNPVVKDPYTGLPYIPGSSLKGKVRSLVELRTGRVRDTGGAWHTEDPNDPVARIFGNGKVVPDYAGGPTRAAFRDCPLVNAKDLIERDALVEVKAEVAIDRLTGTAARMGPRHTERVPAGARFGFSLSYKVLSLDGDGGEADRRNFLLLKIGLRLLELDSLGGSGSRGYGKVKFHLEGEDLEALDLAAIEDFMYAGN